MFICRLRYMISEDRVKNLKISWKYLQPFIQLRLFLKPRLHQIHVVDYKYLGRATYIRIPMDTSGYIVYAGCMIVSGVNGVYGIVFDALSHSSRRLVWWRPSARRRASTKTSSELSSSGGRCQRAGRSAGRDDVDWLPHATADWRHQGTEFIVSGENAQIARHSDEEKCRALQQVSCMSTP